jgi:aryl-alcohol dehydrogenase-like predicted oxidoreductase
MDHVKLGRTGLDVSPLCLGCMTYGDPERLPHPWTLPEDESRPLIKAALDAGINFFDTANAYSGGSSEEIVGRALRDYADRDEIVLATKLFMPMKDGPNGGGLSRKAVFTAIDASLRRLGTDHVDLWQIHRRDPSVPWEETLEALHDVVKAGKVRYLGASSMHAWEFATALGLQRRHGWSRFVTMQDYVSLLYREEEREMLPLCAAEGVGVIPWSPLARGRLARPLDEETDRTRTDEFGKTIARTTDADRAIIEAVGEIAAERGVPRAQVALAWVSRKPEVSAPIVGVSKPGQLTDALASLELQLTDDEVERLESPYRPQEVVGFA